MINLAQLQKEIAQWREENFPDSGDAETQLIGVVEEVGALAHLILKRKQRIRNTSLLSDDKWKEKAEDEVGDIIIYLMNLCTNLDIDIEFAIVATVDTVLKRDWNTWRKEHGTA
tara:strand:- start:297 stop:638 length:342 start_codon:yes stop_codon:yes gene_type:complete